MSIKITEEVKRVLEVEDLEDVYLQINVETLDANRALYDEEDIKDYIEMYGYNPFKVCKRKAGAESYACSKIKVTPEGAAISRRVDNWIGKRQDRERNAQIETGSTVVSLEGLRSNDENEPVEYDIPDVCDVVTELLREEKTRAIVIEVAKVKPYYAKIFGWLFLNCATPTLVSKELKISKSTAFDDIKRVRKIAAEVYHRFE